MKTDIVDAVIEFGVEVLMAGAATFTVAVALFQLI